MYLLDNVRLDVPLICTRRENCAARRGFTNGATIDRHDTSGPTSGMSSHDQAASDSASHKTQSVSWRNPGTPGDRATQYPCRLHILKQVGGKKLSGEQTIQKKSSL
jgi:hypothetical protein